MVDKAKIRQAMGSFMYGRRRRGWNGRLLVTISLILIPFISMLVIVRPIVVPAATVSGTAPLIIYGYVYDSTGSPVDGADVTVTVTGSVGPPPQTTQTLAGGFYQVTFAETDWTTGDTVKVVATYGGESGENQTQADSESLQIDVQMVAVIPELLGPAQVLLVVSSLAVLVVAVSRRER